MTQPVPNHAPGWTDDFLPTGSRSISVEPLDGGGAHAVWAVTLTDGARVVVKAGHNLPHRMFQIEAEGLAVLNAAGLRTPAVLHATDTTLMLERLSPPPPASDGAFWEDAAHAVAALHANVGDRHGWHEDGWFGLHPQRNAWTTNGHDFFAEQRIRRYLREDRVWAALTDADRIALDRLCERLPQLIPDTGARLIHGDLWLNNLLSTPAGELAVIDPAVLYTWPEVDLSMALMTGPGLPDAFYAAYAEVRPLDPEWRAQARLLYLREDLSMLLHFGADAETLVRLRETLAMFR